VSRAGYYRFLKAPSESPEEMELRDVIQRIAVDKPTYGYRRITAQLRRDGRLVNSKRVLRILREDNLLCHRRKKFVRTTDSDHGLRVYPNLAKDLVLTGVNQLWVADISVPHKQYGRWREALRDRLAGADFKPP